jgi:hypothetical protein
MQKIISQFTMRFGQIDQQTVKFILLLTCLALFAIGAGAPLASGGPGLH